MADVDFKILEGAEARSYAAGDVIFRQGDPAEELFVIRSGKVTIRFGDRVIETLEEHTIFGEMALLEDESRSATAVAASDVELVPIGRKQFLFLVSETPHFAINVMRVLARRLRAETRAMRGLG